jgi:hypothetical protein
LIAATAGWPALAGGLIAASVLTKPQGIFVVPAVSIAVWNAGDPGGRRSRLIAAAAGGALVSAVVMAPFVAAGSWWNMVHGVASQANEIYLSMEGYNFWWMTGHLLWVAYAWQRGLDAWTVFVGPVTRIPFVRAAAHGLPFLRVAGMMLALAGIGWGVVVSVRPFTGRGAGAFSAIARCSGAGSENHLFAAMPLLVIAAATPDASRDSRRRDRLSGSAYCSTSSARKRAAGAVGSLTWLDTTLLLAVFNCGLFVWHGAVLRAEARA